MTIPATPPPDKSPDKITPGKSLEPAGAPPSKPAGDFESYMQGTPKPPKGGPGTPSGPNALEAARLPAFQTEGPNFNSLLAQSKTAQDTLGTVNKQLQTPNLKFKRSQSHLLRNKLQDSNTYIRAASNKLGIDTPPLKMPAGASPLDRFLAYINDGQEKMTEVQNKLHQMSANGEQLKPADLLLIQVKMNQAQQEIEYSSTLLSKVIDSIKSIMNIQL